MHLIKVVEITNINLNKEEKEVLDFLDNASISVLADDGKVYHALNKDVYMYCNTDKNIVSFYKVSWLDKILLKREMKKIWKKVKVPLHY